MTQHFTPAAFMRGGSSKGVFFHARDLPAERSAQEHILLAVLGSPDPYGRQLDGMGGGISSLSKAVIIGPPTHPAADVDYTFAQVAVDRPVVDWKSNCGNLSSAVGPFALDEGLVPSPPDGEALVRIHQTNRRKINAATDARWQGALDLPRILRRRTERSRYCPANHACDCRCRWLTAIPRPK